MTSDECKARLEQIRATSNELTAEIANLDARAYEAPADRKAGYDERRARQNAALEKLDNERVEVQGEYDSIEARRTQATALAADPRNRESGDGASRPHVANSSPSPVDGALRAIERNADLMADGAAARVEGAVRMDRAGFGARYIEAVADDEYRTAFGLMLAHGDGARLRMTDAQAAAVLRVHQASESRAMAEGTGSTGGFGVPFALDPTILLSSNGVINPIRELASTVTTTTSLWKGVSSSGVTASFGAEAAEAADGSPTLEQPEINVEKAQCFIPFSIEAGEDYAGIQDELARLLRDEKEVLEASKFLSGAGHTSHEPAGLLTGLGSSQEIATATSKTLASADWYSLKAALPARFIPGASWAAAPSVLDALYKSIGTNSTEPQILTTRGGGVFGGRTAEWSTMATATTTTGEKVALYGDFKQFRIIDRIGMSIELVPLILGANQRPTGQRGLYAYWRTGSGVLVPNALRVLKIK